MCDSMTATIAKLMLLYIRKLQGNKCLMHFFEKKGKLGQTPFAGKCVAPHRKYYCAKKFEHNYAVEPTIPAYCLSQD